MADYPARRTMMVDTQVRPSDVTKFPIIDAMLKTPREAFVPNNLREVAYAGQNLDIGGRTILEPRTFAKMLDALDIGPEDLVLDIGCGLGYSSAVIARLADAVVAVESNVEFANDAQTLLVENGVDNVAVMEGELASGAAKHGPYDVVCIQGAVESVPDAILKQLKENGRIAAIFLDGSLGNCKIGHKSRGKVTWRLAFNAGAPLLEGFERPRVFAL